MGKCSIWIVLFLASSLRGMNLPALEEFPEGFFDDLGTPLSIDALSPSFGEGINLDAVTLSFLSDSSFSECSPILDCSPPPLTPNIGGAGDLEEELKVGGFTPIAFCMPIESDPLPWPALEQYDPQALPIVLSVDLVRASVLLPPKPLMLIQKRKRDKNRAELIVVREAMRREAEELFALGEEELLSIYQETYPTIRPARGNIPQIMKLLELNQDYKGTIKQKTLYGWRDDWRKKGSIVQSSVNIRSAFTRFVNLEFDQKLTIQKEAREIYESSGKIMMSTEIQKYLEKRHCTGSGSDIVFDAITDRIINKWMLKWNTP